MTGIFVYYPHKLVKRPQDIIYFFKGCMIEIGGALL